MKAKEMQEMTKGLTKVAMMKAIEAAGGTARSVMEKNGWKMADIRKRYVEMGLVQKEQETENTQEEETMNKEQTKEETMNTQEQKVQEQAAETKKADRPEFDLVAILQKVAQDLNGEVIDVRPNGKGIKVGRTRVCAIYLNRAGWVRMKTNKVDEAFGLLNEYSTTIEAKVTSDKRDVLVDFIACYEDTVIGFIEDLAEKDWQTKVFKAAEKADAKARKEQEKALEKEAKAAARKAAKEAKEKAKAEAKVQKEQEKAKAAEQVEK